MPRLTTVDFIERAIKIHGDKYDYSKVEYNHSKEKVVIICPIHGEFEIKPNNHLSGQGCPKCGRTVRMTSEEFIKRATKVHGEKYDYSKVDYVNNHTKVCIICPKHGEFWQLPLHHLNGVGCPKCHFDKLSEKYSMKEEEFIKKANELHNGKYEYGNYCGYDKKMRIICPKHGEFFQTPHAHLSGRGCKKCSEERQHDLRTKGFEKFVDEAHKIHGGKYDYIPPYINKDTPIEIICHLHGSFKQIPKIHLKGSGCPICNESKLENRVRHILAENNIENIYQCGNKTFEWLDRQHLDFYLPKQKIAIECQGAQHFIPSNFGSKDKNPNECLRIIQERDERKRKLCEEHGIRLLYFSNKKYSNEIIDDESELIKELHRQ